MGKYTVASFDKYIEIVRKTLTSKLQDQSQPTKAGLAKLKADQEVTRAQVAAFTAPIKTLQQMIESIKSCVDCKGPQSDDDLPAVKAVKKLQATISQNLAAMTKLQQQPAPEKNALVIANMKRANGEMHSEMLAKKAALRDELGRLEAQLAKQHADQYAAQKTLDGLAKGAGAKQLQTRVMLEAMLTAFDPAGDIIKTPGQPGFKHGQAEGVTKAQFKYILPIAMVAALLKDYAAAKGVTSDDAPAKSKGGVACRAAKELFANVLTCLGDLSNVKVCRALFSNMVIKIIGTDESSGSLVKELRGVKADEFPDQLMTFMGSLCVACNAVADAAVKQDHRVEHAEAAAATRAAEADAQRVEPRENVQGAVSALSFMRRTKGDDEVQLDQAIAAEKAQIEADFKAKEPVHTLRRKSLEEHIARKTKSIADIDAKKPIAAASATRRASLVDVRGQLQVQLDASQDELTVLNADLTMQKKSETLISLQKQLKTTEFAKVVGRLKEYQEKLNASKDSRVDVLSQDGVKYVLAIAEVLGGLNKYSRDQQTTHAELYQRLKENVQSIAEQLEASLSVVIKEGDKKGAACQKIYTQAVLGLAGLDLDKSLARLEGFTVKRNTLLDAVVQLYGVHFDATVEAELRAGAEALPRAKMQEGFYAATDCASAETAEQCQLREAIEKEKTVLMKQRRQLQAKQAVVAMKTVNLDKLVAKSVVARGGDSQLTVGLDKMHAEAADQQAHVESEISSFDALHSSPETFRDKFPTLYQLCQQLTLTDRANLQIELGALLEEFNSSQRQAVLKRPGAKYVLALLELLGVVRSFEQAYKEKDEQHQALQPLRDCMNGLMCELTIAIKIAHPQTVIILNEKAHKIGLNEQSFRSEYCRELYTNGVVKHVQQLLYGKLKSLENCQAFTKVTDAMTAFLNDMSSTFMVELDEHAASWHHERAQVKEGGAAVSVAQKKPSAARPVAAAAGDGESHAQRGSVRLDSADLQAALAGQASPKKARCAVRNRSNVVLESPEVTGLRAERLKVQSDMDVAQDRLDLVGSNIATTQTRIEVCAEDEAGQKEKARLNGVLKEQQTKQLEVGDSVAVLATQAADLDAKIEVALRPASVVEGAGLSVEVAACGDSDLGAGGVESRPSNTAAMLTTLRVAVAQSRGGLHSPGGSDDGAESHTAAVSFDDDGAEAVDAASGDGFGEDDFAQLDANGIYPSDLKMRTCI